MAERQRLIRCRGEFYWRPDERLTVRSRAIRIGADRIAPEKFREAVLLVLSVGHGLPRGQHISETRAVLGFSRTGAALDTALGAAVDGLLAEGRAGEGSGGIRLRS